MDPAIARWRAGYHGLVHTRPARSGKPGVGGIGVTKIASQGCILVKVQTCATHSVQANGSPGHGNLADDQLTKLHDVHDEAPNERWE